MSSTPPARCLQLGLPPRKQWEENHGYCGEVSLISAGLSYGQYVSQYDARAIASPGRDQAEQASQLLLGVNDGYAAAQMQLDHLVWDSSAGKSPKEFLAWTKQQIARGYPVVIGIYMNARLFSDDLDPEAGDPEYDHIVPVLGVRSRPPSGAGHAEDALVFSDNGVWAEDGVPPVYVFEYPFASFPASRRAANASQAVYSLSSSQNYGIAITGVTDPAGDTLPVRVTTDLLAEPDIVAGSGLRPPSVPLELTVTVAGLLPGTEYRLYRYASFAAVPSCRFNAAAARAARAWTVRFGAGSTFVLRETIQSSEIAVYRAVRATAP